MAESASLQRCSGVAVAVAVRQAMSGAGWSISGSRARLGMWQSAELSAVVVRLAAVVRSCRDITMVLPACGMVFCPPVFLNRYRYPQQQQVRVPCFNRQYSATPLPSPYSSSITLRLRRAPSLARRTNKLLKEQWSRRTVCLSRSRSRNGKEQNRLPIRTRGRSSGYVKSIAIALSFPSNLKATPRGIRGPRPVLMVVNIVRFAISRPRLGVRQSRSAETLIDHASTCKHAFTTSLAQTDCPRAHV